MRAVIDAVKFVVLYLRVSTAEQVDNFSLDSQMKACTEYCEREGLTIVKVFREEGASAKSTDRPELQEMLKYCTANSKKIDFVVFNRVDRLSRQIFDYQTIRTALKKLGIRTRSVNETFDDSPSGTMVESLMAVLAQFDNDVRGERAKIGMKEGVTRGRWMGQAPLGYLNSGDKALPSLVHDRVSAPLIRLGFESVALGNKTLLEILDELTALGLRTRKGNVVSKQSLAHFCADLFMKVEYS